MFSFGRSVSLLYLVWKYPTLSELAFICDLSFSNVVLMLYFGHEHSEMRLTSYDEHEISSISSISFQSFLLNFILLETRKLCQLDSYVHLIGKLFPNLFLCCSFSHMQQKENTFHIHSISLCLITSSCPLFFRVINDLFVNSFYFV